MFLFGWIRVECDILFCMLVHSHMKISLQAFWVFIVPRELRQTHHVQRAQAAYTAQVAFHRPWRQTA